MKNMRMDKMKKQLTSHEIERKILDYLDKEVRYDDFNPLNLSKEVIADNLDLDMEEVEEAIERLSAEDSNLPSKTLERIEPINPKFKIWLPTTKEGKEVKDLLCGSGFAVKGNLNLLYSFLFVVLFYIIIFEIPYTKGFFVDTTIQGYFFLGFAITAISVSIGKYLSHKWYQLNLLLERVKGIRYYIWSLIIFIILILSSINQGWNISLMLSGIAAVADIILVVYQIVNRRNMKDGK